MRITCYGGVDEIGGNKILLEDEGSAIMLDFGKSFSAESRYFNEFLQPRTNSSLRDLLRLGLLPPVAGIYRHDLLTHAGAFQDLGAHGDALPESAARLFNADLESYDDYAANHGPRIDGVLLSHGHTDHTDHLCYVDRRIPIYCTRETLAVLRTVQDVGASGDICECPYRSCEECGGSSTFPGAPTIKTEREMKVPREDYQRTFKVVPPYEAIGVGGFNVVSFPVDHSVPGACAFLVTSPSGKHLFYTGDLRFHGRFSSGSRDLTSELRDRTAGLAPDLLVTEGTRITSDSRDSEQDVERAIQGVVSSCAGLAIVDFGWKDTTRFQTILNVAAATGRTLAVSPKLAYLWARLRLNDPDNYPDLAASSKVRVYVKRTDSMLYSLADYSKSKHIAGTCADWGSAREMSAAFADGNEGYLQDKLCHYRDGVRAYDIASDPGRYILHAGYFDMNELLDVNPPPGSLFVRAATEPFSDEMEIDDKKLDNWLAAFGIARDRGLSHVSGHAGGPDLLEFIKEMQPKRVVPVHTEHPEAFEQSLGDRFDVVRPTLAQPITL